MIHDEIEQLTRHCWGFERKYGLSSERLMELYEEGHIDDSSTDVREDLVDWVGCFRALVKRRERLHLMEKDAVLSPLQ